MSFLTAIRYSSKTMIQSSTLSPTSLMLRLVRPMQNAASSQQTPEYSFKKPKSYLNRVQPDGKIATFNDVTTYMNKVKDVMVETNPFFKQLRDSTIKPRVRLSFVPYMCGFACGVADFATYVLQVDNAEHILTDFEKKVNARVPGYDFQYNFYLNDLEALGTKLEDFGTLQGVMRYVWSPEAACGRRTTYALAQTITLHPDTRLRMLSIELSRAGLVDFFKVVQDEIVKADNDLPRLEYFGDNNAGLQQDERVDPEDSWRSEPMAKEVAEACCNGIVLTLSSFDQMYSSFSHVINASQEGYLEMKPERFAVSGELPMANILGY